MPAGPNYINTGCISSLPFTWHDLGLPVDALVEEVSIHEIVFSSINALPDVIPTLLEINIYEENLVTKVNSTDVNLASLQINTVFGSTSFGPYTADTVKPAYVSPTTKVRFKICLSTNDFADLRIASLTVYVKYNICVRTGGSSMPTERASILEVQQIGVETTPGTAVAATVNLQSIMIDTDWKTTKKVAKRRGIKGAVGSAVGKTETSFRFNGEGSYEVLPYILSSAMMKPSALVTPLNNGVFILTGTAMATNTLGFSVVDGADTQVLAPIVFANAAALKTGIEALTNVGKDSTIVTLVSATVYKIQFVGPRSGGNIVINTPTGTTTATVTIGSTSPGVVRTWQFLNSYNAPDTVQTYTLEKGIKGVANLAEYYAFCVFNSMTMNINATGVSIQGEGMGQDIKEYPDNAFTLTSLTSSAELKPTFIDPQGVSVWINDASFVDPGSAATNLGRLARCLSIEMTGGAKQKGVMTVNDQTLSYSALVEAEADTTFKLVMERDTQGQLITSLAKQQKYVYLTIEARGGFMIAGTGNAAWPYRVRIQSKVDITAVNFGQDEELEAGTFTLTPIFSDGTNKGGFVGTTLIEVDVPFSTL